MDDGRAGVRRRFDAVVETVCVPADVAAALRAAGYGIRGPAGVGAGGPVWTAVGPPGTGVEPARVVVHALTVPVGTAGAAVTRRLDVLRGLDHPHLARVVDVLAVGPGDPGREGRPDRPVDGIAVLVAEVPGTTLAALLTARGPLSAGEVVALTVPLAGALQALHAAGLVHGDVSPGNIVVRPDGHPVLIDLLGAVRPGGAGRGTPGFVAPEVVAGPAPAAPGSPADVFALATVARTVLDPADVDGPLGQELAAALAPDPVLRPTAGELAAGCFARATPSPIALPDAGVLARTALAQLAGRDRTVSLDRRSRHRAPPRRRTSVRRALGARAGVRAGVGVLTVVGATVAALGLATPDPAATVAATPPATSAVAPTGTSTDPRTGAPTGTVAGTGEAVAPGARRPDPVAAAVELTHRRVAVITGGDAAALRTVVRPGSSAHATDLALLEGLVSAGVRLDGLAATGVTGRARGPGDGAAGVAPVTPGRGAAEASPRAPGQTAPQVATPGARVEVSVTSGLSAHRRRTPDGVVDVAAQPPRTVVLTLVWTADGWRVDSVQDP